MNLIPVAQLEEELHRGALEKPRKYSLQSVYPLNDLDDRSFELLVYALAKQHASIFSFPYDFCGLGLPGGDKGRDVVPHHHGLLCGVVQCKRQKTLIDRPSLGKELLKFVLHCIAGGLPLSPDRQIHYLIACSTGINNQAAALVEAFPFSVVTDKETLKTWCTELTEEYANLKVDYSTYEAAIHQGLMSLRVSVILPVDISLSISARPEIAKTFFDVQSI